MGDPKHIKECQTCTDLYCAECSEADHPDTYCSRVCEGRSETEDSVTEDEP